MDTLTKRADHPGLRVAVITVGALAALLAVVAVVRPEVMGMHAMRELFVGFGL